MNKVLLPKLGDMEEGQILKWLKQEGDEIKKGEPIAEIETEKTSMEMESFVSGTLRKILVPVGQTVPVGAEIALVGDPNEPLEAAPAAPAQSAQPNRQTATASAGPVSNGNGRAAQAPAQAPQPQPVAQAAQAGIAEG